MSSPTACLLTGEKLLLEREGRRAVAGEGDAGGAEFDGRVIQDGLVDKAGGEEGGVER